MGPLVAAVLITAVTEGRVGVRALVATMARWRVPVRWYLTCVAPLLAAGVVVAARAITGTGPSLTALSTIPGLPAVGWLGVVVLVLVVNGYGEETGWRGYAWPRLREQHSIAGAAVLLAVPWAAWHIPTFWIDSGMRGFSLVLLPGFFIGMAAGAVVLGWLYERTGASLPVLALWHTMLNMGSATDGTEDAAAAVSIVVIVWAIAILRTQGTGRGPAHEDAAQPQRVRA
jgi:membrane protease YdiL (CAAX protease family)